MSFAYNHSILFYIRSTLVQRSDEAQLTSWEENGARDATRGGSLQTGRAQHLVCTHTHRVLLCVMQM